MTEYNLIQRPALILKLAQRLGLRQAHITPSLSPVVQATIQLADLGRELGETQHRVVVGSADFTAAAGLFSTVGVLNPTGSGVRVRPLFIATGTTCELRLFTPFGIATALDPGRVINSALGVNPTTGLPGWRQSFPAAMAVAGDSTQIANADIIGELTSTSPLDFASLGSQMILEPGEGVCLVHPTAATVLRGTFVWREESLADEARLPV